MGLISRVSSRTYRIMTTLNFNLNLKNYKHFIQEIFNAGVLYKTDILFLCDNETFGQELIQILLNYTNINPKINNFSDINQFSNTLSKYSKTLLSTEKLIKKYEDAQFILLKTSKNRSNFESIAST